MEHSNLHHRVALNVMRLIGTSPAKLLLGIVASTGILSMWISNTATTAMMIPIVDAVLQELRDDFSQEEKKKELKKYRAMLTMGICFSGMYEILK
jgi:sodium-dependent dicarboxylate transporter 2/3/5